MLGERDRQRERHRAHSLSVASPLDSLLLLALPAASTLFVGRVPAAATHATLRRTFRRYGPILDVVLFTKPATANTQLNFGFVSFAAGSSVEIIMGSAHSRGLPMALEEPGRPPVELLVERRRDQRPNAIEKLTERYNIVVDPEVPGMGGQQVPQVPTRSQRGFRLSSPQRPRSHTYSAGGSALMPPPRFSPKKRASGGGMMKQSPPSRNKHQRNRSLVLSPEGRPKSQQGALSVPMRPLGKEVDSGNPWRAYLLKQFNWRKAASRYLYRQSTMEDYLAEYIHALGLYRGVREEPCSQLMNVLINLSDSCPEDRLQLMPPSISGLVYNQTKGRRPLSSTSSTASNSSGPLSFQRSFRVHGILDRRPDLFRLSDDQKTVVYNMNGTETSASKQNRLIGMLVEGLFVYFFAKFCHGASFPIAFGYYQRSEPVGSAIKLVSGCPGDVGKGLAEFFHTLREIFVFDRDKSSLALIADLYKEENKELTRRLLQDPTPPKRLTISAGFYSVQLDDVSPRSSTSGEEADIHHIMSTTLSPIHKAKLSQRSPRCSGEVPIHSLPFNVQSVVRNVLRTDSEEDLHMRKLSIGKTFPEMLNLPMFDELPTPDSNTSRNSSSFSFGDEDDVFEDSGHGTGQSYEDKTGSFSEDGASELLLTNPRAIDSILDKMFERVKLRPTERDELKVKFEKESRQTIARLLVGAGNSDDTELNEKNIPTCPFK